MKYSIILLSFYLVSLNSNSQNLNKQTIDSIVKNHVHKFEKLINNTDKKIILFSCEINNPFLDNTQDIFYVQPSLSIKKLKKGYSAYYVKFFIFSELGKIKIRAVNFMIKKYKKGYLELVNLGNGNEYNVDY
jgi:hypothetical protein